MGETLRNFKRSNKIAFGMRSDMFLYFKDCFRVVILDNELYRTSRIDKERLKIIFREQCVVYTGLNN